MRQCWRDRPYERPPFSQISIQLSRMQEARKVSQIYFLSTKKKELCCGDTAHAMILGHCLWPPTNRIIYLKINLWESATCIVVSFFYADICQHGSLWELHLCWNRCHSWRGLTTSPPRPKQGSQPTGGSSQQGFTLLPLSCGQVPLFKETHHQDHMAIDIGLWKDTLRAFDSLRSANFWMDISGLDALILDYSRESGTYKMSYCM